MIDSHTHILPKKSSDGSVSIEKDNLYISLFSKKQPQCTYNELIKSMTNQKIKHSVVLGYGWSSLDAAKESNSYILEASQKFPTQLTPFCSINPKLGADSLDELDRCIKSGAKGIGEIHPDIQNLDMEDKDLWVDCMKIAEENHMPILIHASEPVGHTYPGKGKTTPDKIYEFIKNFPQNTIILAHWGGGLPFYFLMEEVKRISTNVFFDTAATTFLYTSNIFDISIQLVGSQKILFGSDFPLIQPSKILETIDHLSKKDLNNIVGRNIKSLIHIPSK